MEAADHRRDASSTEPIGKGVALLRLSGEGGERHKIAFRERIHLCNVVDLVVVDVMPIIGECSKGQESEARK